MAVKLTPTDLPLLLPWLDQYVPQSFKVRAELKSQLKGDNPERVTFFVDRWPHPRALVVREDLAEEQEGSQTSIASVFGVDETALSTLLKDTSAVQWTGCTLAFFPSNLLSTLKAAIEEMEKPFTLHPVILMKATAQDLKPCLLPTGMKFQPVTDTEAGIMHSLWVVSAHVISKTYIQRLTQRFPAVFLVTADGRHVGHMLSYSLGFLGMLYVHPEFRRQGYAKVITTELARRHFDHGEDSVYVTVEDDNLPSINLHEALGFRTEERFTWLMCVENSS